MAYPRGIMRKKRSTPDRGKASLGGQEKGRGLVGPGPALNDGASHDLQYQPDHNDYHHNGYDQTHDVPRHPHLPSPRTVLA
jgi:hypothetical protein